MKKRIETIYITSCLAALITAICLPSSCQSKIPAAANKAIDLEKHLSQLNKRKQVIDERLKRLYYYLDTHDVTEDGYNVVASYAADVVSERNRLHDTLNHYSPEQRRTAQVLACLRDGLSCPPYHWNNLLNAVYVGATFRGKPDGHGTWRDRQGNFYDGFWKEGERDGFGCGIDSTGKVRVGEWKANRYRGERMTHRPERIYGIDIARYQHEYDGGEHSIGWSGMRLWSLGTRTKKQIAGVVDYPISFCFIKVSQGTDVKNRFFHSDYAAARRHGIRVGTYHFFSTKSKGKDQAAYFLKLARFNDDDLPPVLDVEPSEAQIETMGGEEKMFQHISDWLHIVEKNVGVKPILYVNQQFINNHLSKQDQLKQNYQVWIARYGEFRPDVQLAFWQLADDGRVKGINRTVDVNVFNGYKDNWEEWCNNYCIKSAKK